MWDVMVNGQRLGITETNYAYASQYWAQRSRVTGKRYQLVERRHGQV